MNIYLTGGIGFIGSYVVKLLSDCGYAITVLAKNPFKIPELAKLPGVCIIHADMHNLASLTREIVKPDVLIHIALCWGDNGPEMIKNETLASVQLIELAVSKGAKHFIYTSSTAAAGYSLRLTDENSRLEPEDFFGASKGAVELFIKAYARKYTECRFNIIRPGYTFGNPIIPGASIEKDNRFKDICTKAKLNLPIDLIKNDGTQFIWAYDLARIYQCVVWIMEGGLERWLTLDYPTVPIDGQ
ncbi:MAG: NAD(P)-dependent oxidoreductase [Deltaproteobacteria bacterium]|nr:NAD(P)-dependent oxidoreductase [Deltaproteobacteria bacterium]